MPRPERIEVLALVLSTLLVLGWLVARRADVGFPVDEAYYIAAGESYVAWLLDPRPPGEDRASARDRAFAVNKEHPPLAKLAIGLGGRLATPLLGRPGGHRLSAALLFVGLGVGLYLAGRAAWGPAAGAAATLSLLASPHLVGHAFLAALDLPTAALCFAAAMAFHRAARGPGQALVAAVLLGLAFATKLNAFLLPFAFALWTWRHRPEGGRPLAATILVAPAVMVAAWPWLWGEPLARMSEYLLFHARQWKAPCFYFGRLYQDPPAPWHYPLVMTAITLPLPIVLLIVAGAARVVRGRCRDGFGCFVLLNAVLPIVAVARPGQGKYDGVRTFLSSFPFLFLLAGAGFSALLTALDRLRLRLAPALAPNRARALAAAVAALLFLPLLLQVARLHPYELNYYGALAGGMRGALGAGFESTNWGGHPANLEVVRWANRNLPQGATIDRNAGAFGSLAQYSAAGLLRPDITFAADARYWFLECNQGYASGPWWWELYEDRHPRYRRVRQFRKNGVVLLNVFETRAP